MKDRKMIEGLAQEPANPKRFQMPSAASPTSRRHSLELPLQVQPPYPLPPLDLTKSFLPPKSMNRLQAPQKECLIRRPVPATCSVGSTGIPSARKAKLRSLSPEKPIHPASHSEPTPIRVQLPSTHKKISKAAASQEKDTREKRTKSHLEMPKTDYNDQIIPIQISVLRGSLSTQKSYFPRVFEMRPPPNAPRILHPIPRSLPA